MFGRLDSAGPVRLVRKDGPHLALEGISKRFGATTAIATVDLAIRRGEFVTLLGDSGCGKTTLLRAVAGFSAPDSGRILCDGEDVTHLAPAARRMGFVFQSYALFPTKTAAENIGFAPKMAGLRRAEIARRVEDLAAMVEIDHLLDRYPHELSGGQQQRVALARALAAEPEILLLDEPMSALDARIRAKLRAELRALIDRLGLTTLYVTHDQEEALSLSDRVAVMRAGRIEQVGTPGEVYHRPSSRFVAEFIGASNLMAGVAEAGGIRVAGALWPLALPPGLAPGMQVTVMIRPEHLALAAASGGHTPVAALAGTVETATFLGPAVRLAVRLADGFRLMVERPSTAEDAGLMPGAMVAVQPDLRHATCLGRAGTC